MGEPANGAADLPRNGRRIVQFCFAEEKTDLQKVYEMRNGCQECHVRFATRQDRTGPYQKVKRRPARAEIMNGSRVLKVCNEPSFNEYEKSGSK